jgi:hypothetical protein
MISLPRVDEIIPIEQMGRDVIPAVSRF